jgi:hypothetical protein
MDTSWVPDYFYVKYPFGSLNEQVTEYNTVFFKVAALTPFNHPHYTQGTVPGGS